ncbi:MAG: zinc-binding dehydrogenase [Burkholderiales bacterium]|nr:zinc-binding dehydrogenase [Burkholderiales bacterium]
MRAIVIKEFGNTDQLELQEIPMPVPEQNQVLIQIKAFGLNRAELYMRQGSWGDVSRVSGIECVGIVAGDPSGHFAKGQKVIALMGGMGRSIQGSYAEYTCVPVSNVVAIETSLSWEQLAAVPESYATAWSCLHGNLHIQTGQTLLIRGATSALGRAALNIAARHGLDVIATTRHTAQEEDLLALGAKHVLIDHGKLAPEIRQRYPQGIDAVLDIVGNSSILDSVQSLRRYGHACLAGFLGGSAAIPEFNPIRDLPSDVYLSFFASFMLGMPDYPLSAIPFQTIIRRVELGNYRAAPARVFAFEQIREAQALMENSQAGGKLVVRLTT